MIFKPVNENCRYAAHEGMCRSGGVAPCIFILDTTSGSWSALHPGRFTSE
jgi:hypothetical protein